MAWVWPRFCRMHYLRTAACLCLSTLRPPVCHSPAASTAASQLSVAATYAAHCCRATRAIGSSGRGATQMGFSCLHHVLPCRAHSIIQSHWAVLFQTAQARALYMRTTFLSEGQRISKGGCGRGVELGTEAIPPLRFLLRSANRQTPWWSDKVKKHCGCRHRATKGVRDVCPVLFWWEIESECHCVSDSGNERSCSLFCRAYFIYLFYCFPQSEHSQTEKRKATENCYVSISCQNFYTGHPWSLMSQKWWRSWV